MPKASTKTQIHPELSDPGPTGILGSIVWNRLLLAQKLPTKTLLNPVHFTA
jgi:hypothetical protein